MDLETKFKEETGFDAYADNDLRPKVPNDYYVEWLEEQLTISGVVKLLPTKEDFDSELNEQIELSGNADDYIGRGLFTDGFKQCFYWIRNELTK